VTGAPLSDLFPKGKWKDATARAWTALESGQTDWAHLAMAMWPDRVRAAAERDASIAIAHGITSGDTNGEVDPLGGNPAGMAPRRATRGRTPR
jgi:hypothetical protein